MNTLAHYFLLYVDSPATSANFYSRLLDKPPVELNPTFALFSLDQGVKLGLNHPMGPFELADLIGLDTCLAILEVLHDGLGDPKYRPCPLLRKYVAAGWLGRKSKRGFHAY